MVRQKAMVKKITITKQAIKKLSKKQAGRCLRKQHPAFLVSFMIKFPKTIGTLT